MEDKFCTLGFVLGFLCAWGCVALGVRLWAFGIGWIIGTLIIWGIKAGCQLVLRRGRMKHFGHAYNAGEVIIHKGGPEIIYRFGKVPAPSPEPKVQEVKRVVINEGAGVYRRVQR